MKIHTTNYTNTFIQVADDCPTFSGEIPPQKGETLSIANRQFELISKNPYKYTSDDLLFEVFAERRDLAPSEMKAERDQFFSKGQPCLRASSLTKRYGWGMHFDKNGRIALYGCGTDEYKRLSSDGSLQLLKAMKTSK